ncbi:DsbA family protein [Myceligenerans pegani]|uniref:Thioredoxin domain-containing protein n=1 Tax=Myceligenerans pegani TaxID=2776917 RepID=A0ABR9MUY7_9MICO|nr:thioredoxin domain-containing protein [Myceligenerans sp. TRM 65318]MBE1875191.1 thioredoxin domain-containing protein [Myceligenerans sp. TRM 65318]MBE3017462.1 thioredoxin domain-containing protein [Myceligenerans sp. TRM 65318]
MSNMTKAQRREAARAEALAMQKKAQGRERMYRIVTLGVLGLLIAGLGIAIWLIFAESQKTPMERADNVPNGVVDETGIPVGEDGAAGTLVDGAPQLDVYVDFMCPICGQFEALNGADIAEMREGGEVALVVHPVAILDRYSQGTEYSTRAASAVAWVADQAPEAFMEYHDLLFANQPAENSPGLSDQQLADFAEQAGVPADVAQGIADGEATSTFGDWVTAASDKAGAADELANAQGNFGTPTVMLDGERFEDWQTPGSLMTAVTGADTGDQADDGTEADQGAEDSGSGSEESSSGESAGG